MALLTDDRYQALPPFLISLYDYCMNKRQKPNDTLQISDAPPKKPTLLEHVLSPALLIAAGFATSLLDDSWRSTVIFPSNESKLPAIYLLQVLGSVLDSIIFVTLGKLHTCRLRVAGRTWSAPALWAILLLVRSRYVFLEFC